MSERPTVKDGFLANSRFQNGYDAGLEEAKERLDKAASEIADLRTTLARVEADARVLAACFDGMNGADLSAQYGASRSLRIKDAIARHASKETT